ncbi:GGDEF domain-containing protein [Thalassomonas viridans]|uniref:diguanylate cyclase n=1 Tax=Thalassomonas viridans TaxID=137584 RepID=A0AAE9Z790_9GAMM|nr:GGDEF domain-containing protein [Thalassomonas viridans]WDE07522.1 GGDEF domain-containing protein [Thalassomonas viridans]
MQTINILENRYSPFNAFKVFDSSSFENNKRGSALLEQLQVTLDLEKLLNIFAIEAAKYVDFSGLYFKHGSIRKAIRGSRSASNERQFELKLNNEFIGMLTYAVNTPISHSCSKILNQLHQYLLYPMRNAIEYHRAMQLAMQDGLTGLGNRRYFDEQLRRAMHQANRHHSHVGLVVCDLNKFKAVNDTHGHGVGDQVLVHFADALRASVRDSDSLFRFGGDEFAVLVENATEESLTVIKHRINQATANDALLAKYKVSCSLGVALMNRADDEQSLFERADQALYNEKMGMPPHLSLVEA